MASRRQIILAISACAVLFACRKPGPRKEDPLPAEARAYVRSLKLSEVGMQAKESFAQQVITEIVGKITNGGDRTVEFAEVACVFYDPYGQLVLRERVPLVKTALKPGETRSFRLPFDDIPGSWNNQMPQLVIAQIKFS